MHQLTIPHNENQKMFMKIVVFVIHLIVNGLNV